MSKLRSLNTAFWSDPFVEELTTNQKLLYIYLITNEKTNMLGIYEVSIRKITYDTGLNKEETLNALEEFKRVGKVKYIKNYIVLVNYLKHQNFNTNMKKSAIDVYNNLPNELKDSKLIVSKDNALKGFERLLNHYGMVSKIELEVEDEKEDEFEFKNDVLYHIEKLKEHYKENERLISAFSIGQDTNKKTILLRLDEFNVHLSSTDSIMRTWDDYTSHFKNWFIKKPLKQFSNKRPTDNITS